MGNQPADTIVARPIDGKTRAEGHALDKDANKSRRVMEAMMKMIKLDIKTLQTAYAGGPT
jgi:hypothetical protein